MEQQYTTEDVQAALDALELDIQVRTYDASAATAPEAAAAIGTELGSIIKSLCFSVNGTPIMVLAAGDQRVDDRKIAALYNVGRKKVKIADADTTIKATGYAPGGVPPVGHATALDIWIDETLGRFETVYGAAGSTHSIFPIPYETLVAVTGGKVASVARET